MAKRPLSPSTQAAYGRMLTRAFGDAEPPYRVPVTVDAWPESCRALLRAAVKHRYGAAGIDADKVLGEIPIQWSTKKLTEIPTEEEAQAYETAARRRPPGERAMALLPLALGLRSQELLQLTRASAERSLKSGTLVVLRKGGEEQALPSTHAAELVKELLEVPRFNRVSLRESPLKKKGKRWDVAGEILSAGAPITQYHALHALVRRLGLEAGLGDLRPHKLRHAYATRMMRDGAPIAVIQWALGHSSPATTSRYVHAGAVDVAKFARQF